jgi:hypothetical protein
MGQSSLGRGGVIYVTTLINVKSLSNSTEEPVVRECNVEFNYEKAARDDACRKAMPKSKIANNT